MREAEHDRERGVGSLKGNEESGELYQEWSVMEQRTELTRVAATEVYTRHWMTELTVRWRGTNAMQILWDVSE